MNVEKLQESTNKLMLNITDWEARTIAVIAEKIKTIGTLSPSDQQALKNIYDFTGDMNKITKDLATVLNTSIKDVERIYSEAVKNSMEKKLPLYDFKNLAQIPFASNEKAQSVVKAFVKTTGSAMINLSKTKALYLVDIDGISKKFEEVYQDVLDKAVLAVTNGADFYGEMRNTIMHLGGSGVRVSYGGGVTRRLDTVIRQNVLWGAKQASIQYDEDMGEELGCDGFEVDYHSNPRPSHKFMGGEVFAFGKGKTVDGVYYPSGDTALKRLNDYGCLHDKSTLILGVSLPSFSKEEIEKLKAKDEELIDYNGVKKTGYEWKQEQRRLESQIRTQKDIANIQKYSGDDTGRRQTQTKINKYQKQYDDLIKGTGLQSTPERMTVSGFRAVKPINELKNPSVYDIIKTAKTRTGHSSNPPKSLPNSAINHIGKDGKVETRSFYGSDGYKIKDITTHNHGNPKLHPFGKNGEHAHDYIWNEKTQKYDRPMRELTDEERKENSDIL